MGALRDDTSLSILRVLLDKAQFARVIGRAGDVLQAFPGVVYWCELIVLVALVQGKPLHGSEQRQEPE